MDIYWFGFDKEVENWHGHGDSIEECLEECRDWMDLNEYKEVYIGKLSTFKPVIDTEDILNDIYEQAAGEVGYDIADDWIQDVDKDDELELQDELNKVLNRWLKENGKEPKFGSLIDVKCYDIETGTIIEE